MCVYDTDEIPIHTQIPHGIRHTHTPFTLHLTRHLPIQETRTQNTIADPPPAYEYRPCRQPRIG